MVVEEVATLVALHASAHHGALVEEVATLVAMHASAHHGALVEEVATLVAILASAHHGALPCPVSRGPRSAMAQTDVPRTARPRAASRARQMHARSCC